MNLEKKCLLRVPQFSMTAELEIEWENLKTSIELSSPDFYEQIKEVTLGQLHGLPRSTFHTIWKYFNRAKYRATPYGSFASCSFAEIDFTAEKKSNILIENSQVLHEFTCWTMLDGCRESAELSLTSKLTANSSYYQVGDTIRYLTRNDGVFMLAETDFSETMLNILELCRTNCQVSTILSEIPETDLDELKSMIELQLLLPESTPNTIGEDYFRRNYPKFEHSKNYVIAERPVKHASLSSASFKYTSELITLLARLCPEPEYAEMEKFKHRFQRKFEYRAVPLMTALDPELGVDYGNMAHSVALEFPFDTSKDNCHKENALNHFLLEQIIKSGMKVCRLDETVQTSNDDPILPNTIGILCSIVDDLLVVDQICTPTVNRIAGRFSLIGGGTEKFCSAMATLEADANPDVLFFDIGFNDEINVDNINRRKDIYPSHVSILNYNSENQELPLNDILVMVEGEELLLFSKTHQRRVVPRFASGYNYQRSNLPLVRFLCDLQFQGIKSNLDLKLPNLFPDHDFYPRLQFHNIVVSPAQWRIKYDDLLVFSDGKPDTSSFNAYLCMLGLPKYAIVRTEDRTLCFDKEDNKELVELLYILRRFGSFLLEEGFIPADPVVRDKTRKKYNNQFVMTMSHQQTIYHPCKPKYTLPIRSQLPASIYLPGGEWLYFELYAHPNRTDFILATKVSAFVRRNEKYLQKWFFIRYEDTGHHIRLRLKLISRKNVPLILIRFSSMAEQLIKESVIDRMELCTYRQEIERYSPDLIKDVEDHFCTDSKYALSLIDKAVTSDQKYKLCTFYMIKLRESELVPVSVFDDLVSICCQRFTTEFNITGYGFKQLNKKFRETIQPGSPITADQGIYSKLHELIESATALLRQCPIGKRADLLADIFHMHVNRLFAAHQQMHELLAYYFIEKTVHRSLALNKKASCLDIRA